MNTQSISSSHTLDHTPYIPTPGTYISPSTPTTGTPDYYGTGTYITPPNYNRRYICPTCGQPISNSYTHWCHPATVTVNWTNCGDLRQQVTSFGGHVASYKDLPAQAAVGTAFYIEDIDTLVVRETQGWFAFDQSDPKEIAELKAITDVPELIDDHGPSLEQLLPAPKGVTNWPPSED